MAGTDFGINLSAKHCIEIGRRAIVDGNYYQAVDWMGTALAKVRLQNDTTATLTEAEIEFETAVKVVRPLFVFLHVFSLIQMLVTVIPNHHKPDPYFAVKQHDKMLKTSVETDQKFYTMPITGLENLSSIKTRKETLYNAYKGQLEDQFLGINSDGLCQGKSHQVINQLLSISSSSFPAGCKNLRLFSPPISLGFFSVDS